MALGNQKVRIVFGLLLLIRIIPAFMISSLTSNGYLVFGEADPLLYMMGASEIASTGTNSFNFFPPLNFFFIAFFLIISGGSLIAPALALATTGWLTIVAVYFLADYLYDKKTALTAALIYGLYPNLIFYSLNFYAETLCLLWIVCSFIMIVKFLDTSRNGYLVAGGILWGLVSQTRGGLHYFSIFIVLCILLNNLPKQHFKKLISSVVFFSSVYLTFYLVGLMAAPVHGPSLLNSGSGMGSTLHGANRTITPNCDYGDFRGNLFYDVNTCKDQWPEGSSIYSKELTSAGTAKIISSFVPFIMEDPFTYLKNSLKKLSSTWSPNQKIMIYIKVNLRNHRIIAGISKFICIGLVIYYLLIMCGGTCGFFLSGNRLGIVTAMFFVFYLALVFLVVGNSKLRLPLMPFFIIYCAFFIRTLFSDSPDWKKPLRNIFVLMFLALIIGNGIFRYGDIRLPYSEVLVRKIELAEELGLKKTTAFLYERLSLEKGLFTADQIRRLKDAYARSQSKEFFL